MMTVNRISTRTGLRRIHSRPASENRAGFPGQRPITLLVFLALLLSVGRVSAHVPHDVVTDLRASPDFAADRRLYAIVRGALFRSDNAGLEWRRLTRGITCSTNLSAMAISPAFVADQTLFVSCNRGGLFRSQNAGDNWQRLDAEEAPLDFRQIVPSPHFDVDGTILALTSQGALLRSADAGSSWQAPSGTDWHASVIARSESNLAIGTRDGVIYTSDDNGLTWSEFTRLRSDLGITAILPPPTESPGAGWLVGTGGAGLILLDHRGGIAGDSGTHLQGRYITALARERDRGEDILLAATWDDAVFRSSDEGRSWVLYAEGLQRSTQADLYGDPQFGRLQVAGDSTIFVAGFCGVFQSVDSGLSWTPLSVTLHHITGVDVSPAKAGEYVVGLATYGGGVLLSGDRGDTWTASNRSLQNPRLGPIAFSPEYAQDDTLFTGTYDFVLLSHDGGRQWQSLSVLPKYSVTWFRMKLTGYARKYPWFGRLLGSLGFDGHGVFIFPVRYLPSPDFETDRTMYAVAHPGGLLRSEDGGSSFELVWASRDKLIHSMTLVSEGSGTQILFATLDEGIYRSDDRGENWILLPGSEGFGNSLLTSYSDVAGAATVFAATGRGIFSSIDGGSSWRRLSAPAGPAGVPALFAISPDYANDGLLLLQRRGGPLLLCTKRPSQMDDMACDSVETGFEVSHIVNRDMAPLLAFSPDYAEDGTLYAASDLRLMKSTDRARTWQPLPLPRRYEVEGIVTRWMFLPLSVSGQWAPRYRHDLSAGRAVLSREAASDITLNFAGDGIRWIATHDRDGGIAEVFIDGRPVAVVDQFSEERRPMTTSFEATDLGPGGHSITIRVHTGRSKRPDGKIEIDALDVLP